MAENNCSQTLAGIARDCAPSMGGVRRVLIANYSDVKTREVSVDKISTITMESSAKFAEYKFQPETASMTTAQTRDNAAGTNYYATELALQFKRMETAKRVEMEALGINDLVIIVEDNNGAYWYLGFDEPVMATGGESGTGTARGDANKYGITFTDNARQLPYEVDPSLIPTILQPAA